MAWRIRFEKRAQKELERLGSVEQVRILRFLRDRVAQRNDPREIGEALSGPFSDFWKYKVGDYRIIAKIDDGSVSTMTVRVGNRREIYR